MALKTRGSAAIDKAQRRLASLKSISETLDLGYGLTLEAYADLIATTRSAIVTHNILVSQIDESRRRVATLEQQLADISAQMLSAVAVKYGRRSNEYLKAGGRVRRSRPTMAQPAPAHSIALPSELEPIAPANGNGQRTTKPS